MLLLRATPRSAITAVRTSFATIGSVLFSPATTTTFSARVDRGFRGLQQRHIAVMSSTAPAPAPGVTATTCPEPPNTTTTTMTSESSATTEAAEVVPAVDESKPKLPPLTPAEFRIYNHMAEHMELFHNHFRATWNLLWTAATTGRRPAGMSLKAFINEGLSFLRHLEVHHNIEETHIFPVLARKMPEFKAGKGNGAAELLRQHRQIHKGMDGLEEYLRDVQAGREEFDLGRLKERMESWGEVLWTHLDQEVKTLGAENMRLYWTPQEMRVMPM